MSDLSGMIAHVTGAASGIGRELAVGLALKGCKVIISDINGAKITANELIKDGLDVVGIEMDVTNAVQIAESMSLAKRKFGGLDILVNNAGLFTGVTRGSFEDLKQEEWDQVFNVNVGGVFRMVQAAWPLLRESKAGRVINITSATAFSAPPNMLHYVATKGALTSMTRSMAREMGADGITVNAVAPGYTLSTGVLKNLGEKDEPNVQRARSARSIGRDMMPDDLVGAVTFLAGEGAGFISGQTLVVDGGAVMH